MMRQREQARAQMVQRVVSLALLEARWVCEALNLHAASAPTCYRDDRYYYHFSIGRCF